MSISSTIRRTSPLLRHLPWVSVLFAFFITTTVIAATGGAVDGNDYTITADDNINLTVDNEGTPDGTGAVVITSSIGSGTANTILSVDGHTSLATVGTSGLAILNSASVTGALSAGSATVAGHTSLATVGTSGLATLDSATVTNALSAGSASVTGTLSSGAATLDSATVTNALSAGSASVTGHTALTTVETTGLATLNSASVTGALSAGSASVTGHTSLATVGTSGLATFNSASVSTTLEVTGATTLQGATTVNNALSVDSNGAVADGNTLVVDDTSTRITSGSNVLTVDSTNGTTVDGNLTVNGTITSYNPLANSGITNGNSSMLIDGANSQVTITADDNASATDGQGSITLSKTEAALIVTNSNGNAHGLTVTEAQTELSGGTNSTSLTLDDSGATFSDSVTSGPARVTGIANGVNPYDAPNMRQLRGVATRAYSGIASVAALSAIPEPTPGKRYSIGVGMGHYAGEKALAVGFKSQVNERLRFSSAIGRSHGNTSTNIGVGYSW